MFQCSWLINNKQCSNNTDHLVCETCEPEKSRLYHQYKEAEKTVVSAINESFPRGDLLEASKVIGRINRVIKLRRKFTSRLAPQSRDAGHEYHVSCLLEKIVQYQNYIASMSINASIDPETEESTPTITRYHEHQNQMVTNIQKLIESDPFADYDDVISNYKYQQNAYLEKLGELEKLLGCTGDNFTFVTMFIWGFTDTLTQIQYHIGHLAKSHSVDTVYRHGINVDLYSVGHECGSNYVNEVMDVLPQIDRNLILWILQNRSLIVRVRAKMIFLNCKNQIVVTVNSGNKMYNYAYIWNIRVNTTGGYNWTITATEMNQDIQTALVKGIELTVSK